MGSQSPHRGKRIHDLLNTWTKRILKDPDNDPMHQELIGRANKISGIMGRAGKSAKFRKNRRNERRLKNYRPESTYYMRDRLLALLTEAALSGGSRRVLAAHRKGRAVLPEVLDSVPQTRQRRNARIKKRLGQWKESWVNNKNGNPKNLTPGVTKSNRDNLAAFAKNKRKAVKPIDEGSLSIKRALRAIKVKKSQSTPDKAERMADREKAITKKKLRRANNGL
jgi:hypothetical protein